jgi:hypothetical protein
MDSAASFKAQERGAALLIGAARIGHPPRRHDPAPQRAAALQVQLSEARRVVQGHRDASARHRVAVSIDGDLRIVSAPS